MALKGIKVIEFAGLAPGPFCGKILKDLGAKVIRIDRTNSKTSLDRLSHGKQSIAINLRKKEGVDIIKNLAVNADVLIEPFRKGVMERLGLGPNDLCSSNAKLIYARLTGYGQTGELSERAGHDINYLSYSGVLSCFGRESEKPYAPVNIVADFAGGGLMCALSIVTALYQRSSEGKGKVIDLSMVEGAAYTSSWLWSSRDIPGVWGDKRGGNLLDGGYYAYDTYETKDGKYMACGALEPEFYNELLKGLELNKNDDIDKSVLESKFKTKTQDEWSRVFNNLDACVSPVLSLEEAPNNKHNIQRNSFIKLDDGNFMPTMSWLNGDESNKKSNIDSKLPKVGEHTIEILSSFGYTQKQIKQLLDDKIIEQDDSNLKSKL